MGKDEGKWWIGRDFGVPSFSGSKEPELLMSPENILTLEIQGSTPVRSASLWRPALPVHVEHRWSRAYNRPAKERKKGESPSRPDEACSDILYYRNSIPAIWYLRDPSGTLERRSQRKTKNHTTKPPSRAESVAPGATLLTLQMLLRSVPLGPVHNLSGCRGPGLPISNTSLRKIHVNQLWKLERCLGHVQFTLPKRTDPNDWALDKTDSLYSAKKISRYHGYPDNSR